MPDPKKQPAGPLKKGGPAFIVIGKVRRPHGVHGEVVAEIDDNFHERLNPGIEIYLGEQHEKLIFTSQRQHKEGFLLSFDHVNNPEHAGRFRNQNLSLALSETSDLLQGEYYFQDLIDLEVVDETGDVLGKISEILKTGANDVYIVTDSSHREILLPAIPEVIQSVDLDKKKMIVHLLPGLIDKNN